MGKSPVDATTGKAGRDCGRSSASSAPPAATGDGGVPVGGVHDATATLLPGATPQGCDAARDAEVAGGGGDATCPTQGDAGGADGEGDARTSG